MRRPRKPDDLALDPQFHWRVGQLIGSCEMAAWILSNSEDKEKEQLGMKLAETVRWFFEEQG